jgi:two-component system sensor histidine kinase KdpD
LERVHYIEVAQDALVRFESERLRNSVLSVLSHDMRTPLTALAGLVDSLKRTKTAFSEAQLEITTAIQGQVFRINAMVNNLLDMARLQAGEVGLNLQWQTLDEVMDCALTAVENQFASHPVDVLLPPDLPLLEFDAVLIERVLYNLLENAAKYTPSGSRIKVCANVEEGEVRISVTDNGPGLPLGKEEAIFDKFTRGKDESATPGVGLGLAICRTIVKAHNGRIWGENVSDGGARFVFTLPLGTPPKSDDFPDEEESSVK